MFLCALAGVPARAGDVDEKAIELQVRPRVCTLSAGDDTCDTVVRARWRSPRDESLCLLIVGHPEVKECWERHSAGEYTMELAFQEDLVLELRDPELRNVLASAAVTVIREALLLRRKRRQPWSIF